VSPRAQLVNEEFELSDDGAAIVYAGVWRRFFWRRFSISVSSAEVALPAKYVRPSKFRQIHFAYLALKAANVSR